MSRPTIHTIKGNILYPDPGKKCPDCPCHFSSEYDYHQHRTKVKCSENSSFKPREDIWKPFKNGKGEWAFRNKVPDLVKRLNLGSFVIIGQWKYRLSGEKFVVRTKIA